MKLYGIGNMFEDSEGFFQHDAPDTARFFPTREERDQEARKIADELHIKWDGEDGDYMEAQSVTIDSLGQKWYHDYRGFYTFEIDLPILLLDKSKIPPYHEDDREGPVEVVSIFEEK